MEPQVIRNAEPALRQLDAGSELRIIFDGLNAAKHFAMGWVSFEPGSKTTAHTRDVEEVIYILSGEGRIVTKSKEYTLQPGDAILIPAGVEHYHANKGSIKLEQLYFFSPQGPERKLRDLPCVEC
ncbi:MAG: cupin domain-containing protein [bacterium]|nr:cupin domain-containing protein [bacterium]